MRPPLLLVQDPKHKQLCIWTNCLGRCAHSSVTLWCSPVSLVGLVTQSKPTMAWPILLWSASVRPGSERGSQVLLCSGELLEMWGWSQICKRTTWKQSQVCCYDQCSGNNGDNNHHQSVQLLLSVLIQKKIHQLAFGNHYSFSSQTLDTQQYVSFHLFFHIILVNEKFCLNQRYCSYVLAIFLKIQEDKINEFHIVLLLMKQSPSYHRA